MMSLRHLRQSARRWQASFDMAVWRLLCRLFGHVERRSVVFLESRDDEYQGRVVDTVYCARCGEDLWLTKFGPSMFGEDL